MAAGVKPGEIVITVPNTFIATAEAISQAGGRPDFVDIDERTYNLDPGLLAEYLETKCRRDGATGRLIHRALGLPVTRWFQCTCTGSRPTWTRFCRWRSDTG
jgi:dTDP-4-amino-4,6-dideoxygalactose transaminase